MTGPRPAELLRHLAADAASDVDLLRRFSATRDGEAFAELVRRHGPVVLAACRRGVQNHHDAEDAFQAVFLVLARQAGAIRRPEVLGSWLYGVAVRVTRRARRSAFRRRFREVQGVEVPEPVAPASSPDDLGPLLDEELSALPALYRDAVVLCDLNGLSRADAAAALGIPLGTLASRVDAGRKKLAARLVRRGVTLSVGAVLVEGRAVAVPASLLTKTCGLVTVWAAGGLVPAAVLRLARGGATMRGVILGGVVSATLVAGVVFAAGVGGQPPRPSDPPSTGPAPAAATAPWVRRLPSGVTVTLVGVAEHPSKGKRWWGPDGATMDTTPYENLSTECSGGGVVREFAVRVSGGSAGQNYRWGFAPDKSFAAGNPLRAGKEVPEVVAAAAEFPAEQRTATVRLAVAAGEWATDSTHTGTGGSSHSSGGRTVLFGRPSAAGRGTVLAVAHNVSERALRVTAVDLDGRERPAGMSSTGAGGFTLLEAEFDLPPARLKEYRFQTRPYEWAEFRDVPLMPGGVVR